MADILDRLRKLQALSKSDNPHEAALAASLVQKLMMEHHLQEFDLSQDENRPEETIEDHGAIDPSRTGRRRLPTWQVNLADAVARSVDCRIYIKPGESIPIVGRRTDVEAARYTFLALARVIDRLADEAWTVERVRGGDAGRWKRAFRIGAVLTISDRLKSSRREVEATIPKDKAMVLVKRGDAVDTWIDHKLDLRASRSTTTYVHPSGFAQGKAAGHGVSLPGRAGPGLPAPAKRISGA
jgi:hypothetical protein